MVKSIKILVFGLFFLLGSLFVSADPGFFIVQNSISLEGSPDRTITGSFTIENNGTVDLSIDFSTTALTKGSDSISFSSIADKDVNDGDSETVTFSIPILNGKPLGTYTGTITATDEGITDTIAITLVVEESSGGIEITDIDAFLTTLPRYQQSSERANHLNAHDGEDLDFEDEEVEPGSELRFRVNIENLFDDDDSDLENVNLKLTVLEIDDGDDIEVEADEFDLKAGDANDVEMIFNVPMAIEENSYEVLFEVEGESENGVSYDDEFTLNFKVDKETRDILIEEAALFPTKIKCEGTAEVTIAIQNAGTKEETDVRVEIKNSELNLNAGQTKIELDSDPFDDSSEFRKTFTINIPRGTKAKSYPIKVDALLSQEPYGIPEHLAWLLKHAALIRFQHNQLLHKTQQSQLQSPRALIRPQALKIPLQPIMRIITQAWER